VPLASQDPFHCWSVPPTPARLTREKDSQNSDILDIPERILDIIDSFMQKEEV